MTRTKKAVRYQGFALPIDFIEEIKKHIKNKDEYRSVTDYVKQAIREKMAKDVIDLDKMVLEAFSATLEDYKRQLSENQKIIVSLQDFIDKKLK